MGLTNEGGSGGNWLTVIQGEITKRVPAGTENAKTRTNKAGAVVHELKYNALEGMLTRISVYEGDYGKSWIFTISDTHNDYFLMLPYSSGLANGLLFRLPNIKLDQTIKIKTYWIEGKDGKMRQFLGVEQAGEKVAPYFTKEEKHGLPDLKEVTYRNQKVLDDTDRMNFLQRMVDEKVTPKLKEMHPIDNYDQEISEESVEADSEEGINDLPF